MRTASPRVLRWFVGVAVLYGCVSFASWSLIPPRFHCQAKTLIMSSGFGLICTYCILVGVAGSPVPIKRAEHPASFWVIVGCGALFAVFLALEGLGLIPPGCTP